MVWNPSGSDEVHVDTTQWSVKMPWEVRMDNGRHCVYKKGTNEKMSCYETHGEALEYVAALYAKEGGKMSEAASYLINMETVILSEGDSKWVHALPFGEYTHPVFGKIKIDMPRAQKFAESVKTKVRGIEPSINLNHDNTSPDGAAGWVKDADVRNDGLWLFVEFVKDTAQKVRDKKFKYFSIEYASKWTSPEGKEFSDVILGGALTNRPFMKNLVPINLSESVISNSFDLVSAIKATKGEETHMDEKDLNAIIDGVTAKLAEKFTPPKPEVKPTPTPITKLEEVEELRKFAEDNPMAKKLFSYFEQQSHEIAENKQLVRATQVDTKLAEFEHAKLSLTPAAKELAREIMLSLPDELTTKFHEFLESVRTAQTFMVELGERSGSGIRRGLSVSDKSSTQRFMELAEQIRLAEKCDYITAVEKAASQDPDLYEGYRLGDGAPVSA